MIQIPESMLVRSPKLDDIATKGECWITDPWAPEAILTREILTRNVWDPCCGTGIMSHIAQAKGYACVGSDLYEWGYAFGGVDFVGPIDVIPRGYLEIADGGSIFMNPPFSKACQFVDRAMELKARKIVAFQRWSWWESAKRLDWWGRNPPNRIYVCADRATCWKVTVPLADRIDPKTGRPKSTPTAHAFFVWEPAHPTGTVISHISKDMIK